MKKRQYCGIYIIEIISGNLERYGEKYVGKTKRFFSSRESSHFSDLKHDCHGNPKLKHYYNKYGKSSLKFTPLMECPENELNFWEKFWIKAFDSHHNGLNCTDGGEDPPVHYRSGRLQNIITGEIVNFNSLLEFAGKYNIKCPNAIGSVLNGKANRIGEWFCPDNEWKPPVLKDPQGNLHTFLSVKEFSKTHNLVKENVSRLLNCNRTHHRGWTNPNDKTIRYTSNSKEFMLLSPVGEKFIGKNMAEFCRNNNLRPAGIHRVISGERKSYKGWTNRIKVGLNMLSNLLTSSDATMLSGIFANHFPLFSFDSNNFITVVKQPIQTINNPNENVLPGYGADVLNVTDITYAPPVTGVFPAIIIYPHTLNSSQFGQLKFEIDDNQVIIKVQNDAKDFMIRDLTQRIIIDEQFYNMELTYSVQSYLGLKYYYFKLTSTK